MAVFTKKLFFYLIIFFLMTDKIISKAIVNPKTTTTNLYSVFETEFLDYFADKTIPDDLKQQLFRGWLEYDVNVNVSDMVDDIGDQPQIHEWCSNKGRFLDNVPATSIIIYTRNEATSVLKRAISSILKHTPPNLIHEIILVDDFSKVANLAASLGPNITNRVTIMRTSKFEGSVRARFLASKQATGEILTFVDSRCECYEGWLKPLLDRVARDPTRVVSPVLSAIDKGSLHVIHYQKVGTFLWNLELHWASGEEPELLTRMDFTEPFGTPATDGLVFSIQKAFFERLRIFDRNFRDGDHLELSLKAWMCGGSLEIVPCSRVAYMDKSEFLKEYSITEELYGDYAAKGWLDEYAKYYFYRKGLNVSSSDNVDVTEIKGLRKKLGCKSFKWYLDNVFPELRQTANAFAHGLAHFGEYCLDGSNPNLITVTSCNDGLEKFWILNIDGEIRYNKMCLEYNDDILKLSTCHGLKGNQRWQYEHKSWNLRFDETNICLSRNKWGLAVLEDCEKVKEPWFFSFLNSNMYFVMTGSGKH